MVGLLQLLQCLTIKRQPMTLHQHFAIPRKAKSFQGTQNVFRCTWHDARPINILDAQQPLTTLGARIQIAAKRRQ